MYINKQLNTLITAPIDSEINENLSSLKHFKF